MSKHISIEADTTLHPKVAFLNSVFLFAGIVAFGMGFFRWQSSVILGSIDFVFSLCSFALVYYLNKHKERVAAISSIALALSYCLFTAIYLLAPYNTSRISLFFLLSASAFFLKGRQAGLAWLILILTTVVVGHFLSGFDTAYSHIDIVTTSLYLLALFFIFINYEKFKEKVNERDLDKEVLRLSEERFRTMVDNGNDIIGIISDKGVMRFISPSVEPVLGFEPDEMIGKQVNDLIHPDEQPKAAAALANALAHPGGETLERYEFCMKRKDGSYRDIEMVGRNLIGNPVIGGIVLNGRDITERKRNEETLRTLSTAVEQSPLSVVITDLDATIQYVNPHFANATGYSREEVVGQNPRILQSGQTPKETYVELWDPLTSGKVWRGELINKRKNGELYWEEAHIAPVVNAAGATTHYVAVKLEITRRKQTEDALRESQARQSAILNNSPYLVWLKDTEGRYLKVNKIYADYARLKDAQQIIGKTDFDLWPRELAEKYRADDAEVMASRQQKHVEEPSLDGEVIHWVETFKTPVIDENGNVLGTTGFARDITERKQAEQALAESESRFREIFNTVSDAIFIHDAATGRIIDVNCSMCEMYGMTREEALACGPDDLSAGTPPYSSAEATEKIHRARLYGPQTFEWLARARDGHLFWVEVSLRFASICGNERILATVRDITERKQVEQALAESESRFRAIIEASPVPFALNDEQQNITYLNSSFIRTFGYTLEDIPILAQWWPKAYPDPTYRQWVATTWQSHLEKARRRNEPFEPLELNIRCKDGSIRTALAGAAPIGGSFEKIHLVSLYDITERKRIEQNLRESEARFRAVAQSANDAIITANDAGAIMDCNAATELFFGYTKAEINGQPLTVLMPERFRNRHNEGMARVVSGGAPHIIGKSIEAVGLRKEGVEFPLELSLAQWQTADGQFFTAIIRDITERKQAEEQIRTLAFYDALTQLPNRRLLNDRLEQTIAASKRSGRYGALMFLDLDNFKPLNDMHGHGVGDLLLIEVAHRITSCVREVDTVARFGGDEFVVMLGELDADKTESAAQAGIVAEKIRSTLAEPYLLKIQQKGNAGMTVKHHCASSIGVVVFNSKTSMEDIIKRADTAMYQAKEGGRNQVNFFDSKS